MPKKLISFLGTQDYKKVTYIWGEETLPPTRFIQEALFRVLARDWGPGDQVVILLTEEAREKNFPALKEALEAAFREAGIQGNLKDVSISADESEEGLWDLYGTLLPLLKEGDHLFFDVTHGFRFLSLFAYGVVEYGRVLKRAQVGGIYYGLLRRGEETHPHPIVDLTPLVRLLDWAHGTRTYLQTGDARPLEESVRSVAREVFTGRKAADRRAVEAQKNLVRDLKNFHENMATCRTLLLPENVASIQMRLKESQDLSLDIFPLLDPLLEEIREEFARVAEDIAAERPLSQIGWGAARWCKDHGLIQQAYTFLVEAIYSKGAEFLGLDPRKKEDRERASQAINAFTGRRGKVSPNRQDHPMAPLGELINQTFSRIVDTRNAINHGNITQQTTSSDNLMRQLEEDLENARRLMAAMEAALPAGKPPSYAPRLLILLSHRLLPQQEADARESLGVTAFTYLPDPLQSLWSQIDPSLEELEEFLQPIGRWLEEEGQPGDYVLIQGEYGATVWAIGKARALGLIPVYATTRREVVTEEGDDGQVVKKAVFRHVRFRLYPNLGASL
ncbi:MAG: TIGR02221 family CRISPR-associated protein [Clostridiales bacterium]|nr:TIGR02221 family CRISPR-associated protein [Clostridiales bacterium]